MNIDDFWIHLSGRSNATLTKICMKRNCPICEYWVKRIDLYRN